jgi:hypothetical protein
MLMDADLAIKRLNTEIAKLDKVLSFRRSSHDKTGLGYNESNKTTVTHQNLIVVKKNE